MRFYLTILFCSLSSYNFQQVSASDPITSGTIFTPEWRVVSPGSHKRRRISDTNSPTVAPATPATPKTPSTPGPVIGTSPPPGIRVIDVF